MTNHNPPAQILQHALLDIEDRIARLQELLHLVVLAGKGLDEPQSTAIAHGIHLARAQTQEIGTVVAQMTRRVGGSL